VRVIVASNANNRTLDDLLNDINAALKPNFDPKMLSAGRVGNRISLMTHGLGRLASLVLSDLNAVARDELHFAEGQQGVPPLDIEINGRHISAPWRDAKAAPLVEQFQVSGLGGDDRIEFAQGPSAVDVSDLTARSDDWVAVIDGGPGNDVLMGS